MHFTSLEAAKRKGMRMCGLVPLRYAFDHRKPVIVPGEAKVDRAMFSR